MWIALAAVAAVIIVIAVAVPLVLAARDDGEEVVESTTTSVTEASSTTTTTEPRETSSTTEEPTPTTTSSLPPVPGVPGDSNGEWVEAQVPQVMTPAQTASLSDDVLVVKVQDEGGYALRARLFATGETFELPVGDGEVYGIDVDEETVVWWEGSYDEATSSYVDQHIYAYRLPDGPKIDIAGGSDTTGAEKNVSYPQIAGSWVTWVEGSPWEESPDEYWRMPLFGSLLDSQGQPVGEATSLVPGAIAFILGDSFWTYSLSGTFLAWEQAAEVEGFATGTYVLDLGTNETGAVGPEAWRPSLAGDTLVYWENGLMALDLTSGERWQIDTRGDFGTAAPTFAAYFRSSESAGGAYEIVARGYSGAFEQVLTEQTTAPPWLSAPIAVSSTRVAFLADDSLRLFEWQAR